VADYKAKKSKLLSFVRYGEGGSAMSQELWMSLRISAGIFNYLHVIGVVDPNNNVHEKIWFSALGFEMVNNIETLVRASFANPKAPVSIKRSSIFLHTAEGFELPKAFKRYAFGATSDPFYEWIDLFDMWSTEDMPPDSGGFKELCSLARDYCTPEVQTIFGLIELGLSDRAISHARMAVRVPRGYPLGVLLNSVQIEVIFNDWDSGGTPLLIELFREFATWTFSKSKHGKLIHVASFDAIPDENHSLDEMSRRVYHERHALSDTGKPLDFPGG
jgi:hypothetical protein